MKLLNLGGDQDDLPRPITPIPHQPDPQIELLHRRLITGGFADSLEVKIALLADLVYRIYLNTTIATQGRST